LSRVRPVRELGENTPWLCLADHRFVRCSISSPRYWLVLKNGRQTRGSSLQCVPAAFGPESVTSVRHTGLRVAQTDQGYRARWATGTTQRHSECVCDCKAWACLAGRRLGADARDPYRTSALPAESPRDDAIVPEATPAVPSEVDSLEAGLHAAAEAAPGPMSPLPAARSASAEWQRPRNRAYMLAFAVLTAWLACIALLCLIALNPWGVFPLAAAALGATICGIYFRACCHSTLLTTYVTTVRPRHFLPSLPRRSPSKHRSPPRALPLTWCHCCGGKETSITARC
jgi:hypothetical protein